MSDIKELEQLAEKLEVLSERYSQLSWTQYTVGFDLGLENAYKEMMDAYKDKKHFDMVSKYKERTDLNDDDTRRVELLYNSLKDFHLDPRLNELNMEMQKQTTELSKILNTHRPIFEGSPITSVEINEILTNDPNENRRKEAYFARNQINKPLVDAGFINLLNLRKEYAKLYGAKDFVEYSLNNSELDPQIFKTWKQETINAKEKINSQRAEFAQKYLGKEKLNPWDLAYLSSKIAPFSQSKVNMTKFYAPIKNLFSQFGFNIDEYNITYDIFSRRNKSEWGYNFTIKHGVDSRILANVKDKFNEFGVLLHETGHAVHSFNTNPKDILMNYGISGIISEGIANLFGDYMLHENFYNSLLKNDLNEVKKQFSDMKRWNEINHLRATLNILFDQDLYRTKIESLDDINNLYHNLSEELTGDAFREEEPVWGFRIHHTTHPIYLHNYFMGDVTSAMLKSVFRKKHGVNDEMELPKEFGKFLDEKVIKPAGKYKYAELFKQISGEDFSLKWITDKI